jgi:hypothetical protein
MLTADRGESSIHDFINDDVDPMAVGHPIPAYRDPIPAYRDREIGALKAQLDDIFEHVCLLVTLLTYSLNPQRLIVPVVRPISLPRFPFLQKTRIDHFNNSKIRSSKKPTLPWVLYLTISNATSDE